MSMPFSESQIWLCPCILQVDEVGLEQVPDVIQDYNLCVVKNRRIDSDIIAKATQMKIIMQYGVGLEGD